MSEAPAPRRRGLRNRWQFYGLKDEFGRLQRGAGTVDGSVLDVQIGDYFVSSAWRDPACELKKCFLPKYASMLPSSVRRCPVHGHVQAPAVDPYPLTDDERRTIERLDFGRIAAQWKIPARYRTATLERAMDTEAIRVVREYDEGDDATTACWCFAGPTGVGKTHALIAYFRQEAVWHCDSPAFVTFPRLVRLFVGAEKLFDDEGEPIDPLATFVEADLLMVDDVGSAYLKDGGVAESLFEELIVAREAEELQTLLTTNLRVDQFRQVLGDRIADRVLGEWGRWASITGASLRRVRAVASGE